MINNLYAKFEFIKIEYGCDIISFQFKRNFD